MLHALTLFPGSKWPVNDLTYKITKYTPDMTTSHVDDEIKRAFDVSTLISLTKNSD